MAMTCRHLPERHTAKILSEWFHNEVENYGIKSKLVRVGRDRSSQYAQVFMINSILNTKVHDGLGTN